MADWIASRGQPPRGVLQVPGDKSVSHRAVMLASIADGTSRIDGFLEGEDTRATAAVFAALGVRIEAPEPGVRIVHGVGIDGLRAPVAALDCGNAGTAMRLLAGLLAGQPFASRLVGDASLSARPMARVTVPLARMGARIRTAEGGLPPLDITPVPALQGIDITLQVASAQVKSAVLLAGLQAHDTTCVHEPRPTRDYTERMLRAFGVALDFKPGFARIEGGQRLGACDVHVPADFSSAAFALSAAAMRPGAELRLPAIGIDPRRTGLLHVLRAMGADIEVVPDADDPAIGDILVRGRQLRGIDVPVEAVADMIDEFPVLFAVAALARGVTRVRGAQELRVKESDRIATMAAGLRALGIRVDETDDGADIHGGAVQGGRIDSHGDHRIAMAFVVAAQCSAGEIRITDVANVATSYPGFAESMRSVGMSLRDA